MPLLKPRLLPLLLGALSAAAASTPATAAPAEQPTAEPALRYRQLDWLPYELLSAEQQAATRGICQGAYVEPPLLGPDLQQPPEQAPLRALADSGEYEQDGLVQLQGNVQIFKGYRQALGDRAELDQQTGIATLQGEWRLREPGLLLIGERGQVALDSGNAEIEQARYVLHQQRIRGSAERVSSQAGVITLQGGSYTTCEPHDNAWELIGSRVDLNRASGWGDATHVRLKVKGVPVFYTPYLRFPIDDRRHTGLLPPSFSIDRDGHVDATLPLYLNLAPNYDATLAPRYMDDRGTLWNNEFRYLLPSDQGQLNFNWLPEDRVFDNRERWLLAYDHSGRLTPRWRYRIDYNEVSDAFYFDDLGDDLSTTSATQLQQLGELTYSGDIWHFAARAQDVQTLDPDLEDRNKPYAKLPQLTLSGRHHSDHLLSYSLDTEAVRFYRYVEDPNPGSVAPNGAVRWSDDLLATRLHLEPAVSLPLNWPWAFVTPKVQLKHTRYYLDRQPDDIDNELTRTLPVYSLDSGLFFERPLQLAGQSYTQTLEPRLFYAYVPFQDQSGIPEFDSAELTFNYNQLFRAERFSGKDRVGDTNQLTAALTTRLLEDASGRERLSLSAGQIYYFEDRRVLPGSNPDAEPADRHTASESPIAVEANWLVTDALRLRQSYQWDHRRERTDRSITTLSYQSAAGHALNLSHRYTAAAFNENLTSSELYRLSTEQTDVSFVFRVTPAVALVGRWQNDLVNRRSLETMGGLQYESCCWAVRLLGRSWLSGDFESTDEDAVKVNEGIFFEFILKGLGGFGKDTETFLTESIPGYRP